MLDVQQSQFLPAPYVHHITPQEQNDSSGATVQYLHYDDHPSAGTWAWETKLEALSPGELEDVKALLPLPATGVDPYAEIVEQPQQRGFRFRYRCEGPSHGGLQGEHSERGNKTYPGIKICNHSGPAVVMVTLVTDEKVPRTHAHELMGKHCQNGICVVEVQESPGPDSIVTFPNLGILHVTKKKVESILKDRIMESMKRHWHLKTSNFSSPLPELTDDLKELAAQQAKEDSKKMALNVVRLRFQVYLQDANGNFSHQLDSIISKPIFDSKCPGVAGLNICRMDRNAGCSTGYEEVFLLCDKVQKDDILVRFYEKDEDDHVKWEAFGNFGPSDVHRQYAIVFKTPPYRDPNITAPVQVMVQLKRISDHETSEAKPFTYFPQQVDKDEVGKKRRKTLPFDSSRYRDGHFQNHKQCPGSSSVPFCSGGLGGTAGANHTGNGNSERFQNFVYGQDVQGSASGPRHELQNAGHLAAPADGLAINPCQPHAPQVQIPLTNQSLYTKLPAPNPQIEITNNTVPKPMEITPDTTTIEELKSFLETCDAGVLLTPTAPLSVTTPNDLMQQQLPLYRSLQAQPQKSLYVQQQQQQQQQLPQAFPQMAQIAPMPGSPQTMQTASMQQSFPANIPPPPQYNQTLSHTTPAYSPAQGQYSPAQGQYSPAQGQFSPAQGQYSPAQGQYSPAQGQYSPASQQAFSPGAQQAYSPGSTTTFSPGAQQQQFSPQGQQYRTPPLQQASPTAYILPDVVTDGGDVDSHKARKASPAVSDKSPCVEYVDNDLEEDAIPLDQPTTAPLSEDKKERAAHNSEDILADELSKLSIQRVKANSASPRNQPKPISRDHSGEENIDMGDQDLQKLFQNHRQSSLDLQLATNVAKRSLVALHNYTKSGNPVYLVLCQRHLISVQDDLGDTALHMAIMFHQGDVTFQLLQAISTLGPAGADVINTVNILRQTPLQLAVLTQQTHLIYPMIIHRANCHIYDKDGNTCLHAAAKLGYTESVYELLRNDATNNQRQLEALNYDGFSPLHLAINHGHFEVMKILLERGADINQKDGRSGRTALHHAVERNDHAMTGYILLKTDVDVNTSTYDRNTALHIAVGRRLYDMAKLLIDSDADAEAENSELVSGEYEDDIVEDSDDVVEDNETTGYVRPIDMAQGDEKMLRILKRLQVDQSICRQGSNQSMSSFNVTGCDSVDQGYNSCSIGSF